MAGYSKSFRDAKDSAENMIVVDGDAGNEERPDYQSPAYKDLAERASYVRACHGGTETMRAEGQALLPKMAREDDDEYRRRRMRSVAFNAVARTAAGLAGMLFRKDLVLKDGPDQLLAELDDVDLLGNDINVFARRVAECVLRDGYGWVHVESPDVAASNRMEEIVRNVRPYWLHIDTLDAINWQYEIVDGIPKLSLFVYREHTTEPVGTFGARAVERYRVLRPGRYEVYQKRVDNDRVRFELVDAGQAGIPEIPVVFVPGLQATPEMSRPALLGVADLQVAWYQRWSMYNLALDYAVPMIGVIGEKADNLEVGAGRAIFVPDAEGDIKIVEMAGGALSANREQLKDLEQQMAIQGLSMLSRETRQAETAEAKRIDKSESDSQLAVLAKSLESSLNSCLYYHALYRNDQPVACSVNRDFMDQRLDGQTVQVLSAMVLNGQLSLETLWQTMVQGEILPDGFDPEVERVNLGDPLAL